ncbi:hypothetical protein SAY86_019868 [Trapa natans]|uniref:WAT1-related protein n=1 Tax=Trapa natans TaxID=22666 RepID=A0AAN7LPN3_TRANT|nr:hypothetical protein SAY86_019868 [Trapa natans]
MESGGKAVNGMKAVVQMVLVQVATAVGMLLYRMALTSGMSSSVLVAYRSIFATAFMIPVALFFERKDRPKLTWKVTVLGFFSGFAGGAMAQNLVLESLAMTSATFASALLNLIPGTTFILAILFRLEKLRLGTMDGRAKVGGTLMGMGGAMLMAFYKGPEIHLWDTHVDLLKMAATAGSHSRPSHPAQDHKPGGNHMALGLALAMGSCISYSLWFNVQAKMSASYPVPYSSSALMSFMGSIQSVAYALCRERHWDQWRLGLDIRLITVSFSGIVISGMCIVLYTLSLRERGPLFTSAFSPLLVVIVAIAASLVLDEKLHLGSALGAVLILSGLYAIIWGKHEEMKSRLSDQLTVS